MSGIKNFINSKNVAYIEIFFKVVYLVHLLFAFNVYISEQSLLNVTLVSILILGSFIAVCRLLNLKLYFKTPGLVFLIAFWLSFLIPSFLIYRYDVVSSLKTAFWMFLQFGILFCFSINQDKKTAKVDFNVVSISLLSIVSIENIYSIYLLIQKYFGYYEIPSGKIHLVGLTPWGRLFGIHTEVNYSSVYSVVAVLVCIYLITKSKKLWLKIILGMLSFINFSFVIFTGSRTGLLSAAVGISVALALLTAQRTKSKVVLKSIAVFALSAVIVLTMNTVITKGYNRLTQLLTSGQNSGVTVESDDNTVVGRDEPELKEDVSNRRFDIWLNGLDITKENIVFGIGFENILGYAQANMPDSYIINNDHADFDSFHNIVVDVLVSQGFWGFIIIAAFGIVILIKVFKNYNSISSYFKNEAIFSIAICLSVLFSALFISHVLFVNTPTTYLFWVYAGYLAYYVTVCTDKETKTVLNEE